MPFRLSLYRAREGLGPLHTWDREHREPLGTRDAVQTALQRILPRARWESSERLAWASCAFGGEEHACEITLFGAPRDALLDISVYSAPPAVRAIMSALDLNYCYAQDSGVLYFPFQAGDRWPGAPG